MNERTPTNDDLAIAEELVAYLDGELNADASSLIERRLAEDPKYRAELRQLQWAWDMLDCLPRAQVGDEFTQTTVEIVAQKAADEAQREGARRSVRRYVFWSSGAASVLAAALLGYTITHWIDSAPNRRLVRDLPIIENVDLYYHVDSIEFLRSLEESDLFADDLAEINHAT